MLALEQGWVKQLEEEGARQGEHHLFRRKCVGGGDTGVSGNIHTPTHLHPSVEFYVTFV